MKEQRIPVVICRKCKLNANAKLGGFLAWDKYGLCPDCLENAIDNGRMMMSCHRCGNSLKSFDERHYYCQRCAEIIAKDKDDKIRGFRS